MTGCATTAIVIGRKFASAGRGEMRKKKVRGLEGEKVTGREG